MESSGFNFIDGVVAVVLLVGILGGLKRGLSGELSRVIAIVVAVFAAWRFATPVADWAMARLSLSQDRAYLTSFIFILVAAFAALWIVRATLRSLMEFAFKGKIERIGGAIAGLLRAAVIAAALVLMLEFAPQPEIRTLVMEKSFVGRLVAQHLRPVYENLQQKVPELGLPAPSETMDPDLGEEPVQSPPPDENPPPHDIPPP